MRANDMIEKRAIELSNKNKEIERLKNHHDQASLLKAMKLEEEQEELRNKLADDYNWLGKIN